MADELHYEVAEGIARITLNRAKVFNAMNDPLLEALLDRLLEARRDSAIQAVIVTGEGKAFSAGVDLKFLSQLPEGLPAAVHRLAGLFHQSIIEVRRMPKPVIAAVNGIAAGAGFSLALACDFRIMAQSAALRQVYTSWGLCIDGGGTFALSELLGRQRALEIAAFDEPIDADRALAWGLTNRVCADGAAMTAAIALAKELMPRSLHAFAWAKRLITDAPHTPLEVQLEREREGITACVRHADGQEGVQAFLEKRAPVFNHEE